MQIRVNMRMGGKRKAQNSLSWVLIFLSTVTNEPTENFCPQFWAYLEPTYLEISNLVNNKSTIHKIPSMKGDSYCSKKFAPFSLGYITIINHADKLHCQPPKSRQVILNCGLLTTIDSVLWKGKRVYEKCQMLNLTHMRNNVKLQTKRKMTQKFSGNHGNIALQIFPSQDSVLINLEIWSYLKVKNDSNLWSHETKVSVCDLTTDYIKNVLICIKELLH